MTERTTPVRKYAIRALAIVLMISQMSCNSSPQKAAVEDRETAAAKIEAVAQAYAENQDFNGAILVAREGKIVFKSGLGMANMEWGIPNGPTTRFRIGSITKQFTAMLAMQLVADGVLDLHTPITQYLPDFPEGNGQKITLHHLLSHSAGIPEVEHGEKENAQYRPVELIETIAKAPLDFAPGARFEYSNSGYVLVGYILETVTGQGFEALLHEKILTPLQMNNTGMDNPRSVMPGRASGYFKGGGRFWNADYHDMSKAYAAGAMYSTVEDLYLWDRALYTEMLLPKAYMNMLFTKHMEDPTYGGHYGYGWELGPIFIGNTSEKAETIRHDGVVNGFCALITRIPSSETCIILLSNTRRGALYAITSSTAAILTDKTYDIPRKSMAYALSRRVAKMGTDSISVWLDDMRDTARYYLDENEINILGYGFLENEQAEVAATLFLMNVKAFPNSFNAYDSYGESLMVLGDTAGAIREYKKSLELNPNNENGAAMLRRLEKEGL